MSAKPVQKTIVTRERVVAPPDRFIDVTDGELINYFQGVFSAADRAAIPQLNELLQGLCSNGFSRLRRALEQDFSYFAHAAAAEPGTDPRERDPASAAAELDGQEARFLANFMELLDAGQYKLLTSAEWDAACAEEFLLTLPVGVNWGAMDSALLPRALWAAHSAERDEYPAELADRILIFHRGVDVARMRGTYYMQKIDLLLSFYLIQPAFRAFSAGMAKLGVTHFVPEAPAYMAPADAAAAAVTDDTAHAVAKATSAAIRSGALHEASINVERHTFARTFPDGASVLAKLTQTVELREACFKDVVVLYRRALPVAEAARGEMEIVKEADPAFLQRNLVIKRFASIPIADLELVFPDKKIFMPPQVIVNMAVSIAMALVALFTMLRQTVSIRLVLPVVSMLGTRAFAVYTAFNFQVTTIGRAMQRLLYERTVASQAAVLSSLTEDMANQRTRELMVAYCVLATAAHPLTLDQLDARCEAFLAAQFGLKLDFTCEEALPQLMRWGVAVLADPKAATFRALPLSEALPALDAVWDSIYDFSTRGAVAAAAGATGTFMSGVLGSGSTKQKAQAPKEKGTAASAKGPAPVETIATQPAAAALAAPAASATAKPASVTSAPAPVTPHAAAPAGPTAKTGAKKDKKKGLFARFRAPSKLYEIR